MRLRFKPMNAGSTNPVAVYSLLYDKVQILFDKYFKNTFQERPQSSSSLM